jgi:hypothetical protein
VKPRSVRRQQARAHAGKHLTVAGARTRVNADGKGATPGRVGRKITPPGQQPGYGYTEAVSLRIMTTRSGPSPRDSRPNHTVKLNPRKRRTHERHNHRELRPSRKSSQVDSQGSAASHPHSSVKRFPRIVLRKDCCRSDAIETRRDQRQRSGEINHGTRPQDRKNS